MNCNCTKACPIPYCITELEVGKVEPGLTGLIVEIKDTITGRVKKLTDISPQADGLLILDVEDINSFFSPNFSFELKVLYSDESGCATVPITIGDETVTCVSFDFVSGESTKGVFVLEGQSVQYMIFTSQLLGGQVTFTPTFTDTLFVADWGDGTSSLLQSGMANTHTYGAAGTYTIKIRGDFSSFTQFINGNLGAGFLTATLPTESAIANLRLVSNSLSTASVNNVLVNLDNAGITNGIVNLSNQSPSAPPTNEGLVAKDNLVAKGWTVTTD